MTRHSDETCMELSFPASEADASVGIARLSARLAHQGLSPEKAGDVKIALAEAINNVVEHAYADIEPARVQISCKLDQNRLDIVISDTGHPLPGYQPPDGVPASVETDLQDLPEGGFGWYLIHQLTSEIRYERRNGCNLLSLRFDIPKPV